MAKTVWPFERFSTDSNCGYPVSPHPSPLPEGEGETLARALVIRPSLVVGCLRDEWQRSAVCNRNVRVLQRRASALPLLGERAGVRANEANSNPRHTTIPGTVKLRESPCKRPGFPNLVITLQRHFVNS